MVKPMSSVWLSVGLSVYPKMMTHSFSQGRKKNSSELYMSYLTTTKYINIAFGLAKKTKSTKRSNKRRNQTLIIWNAFIFFMYVSYTGGFGGHSLADMSNKNVCFFTPSQIEKILLWSISRNRPKIIIFTYRPFHNALPLFSILYTEKL